MDPYVYPETSVLRNLRDIRDPNALAQFEADVNRDGGADVKSARPAP